MICTKYFATARMSCTAKTGGGVLYLYMEYLLRFLYLFPLLLLWRSLFSMGVDVGMSLSQMLTYSYLSVMLTELLNIKSQLSNWFYDGAMIGIFQRPMDIFGQLVAHTVGGWIPLLVFFSLPLIVLSPFLGISLTPATAWFFPSLLMTISLGFAMDFIFASISIRMKNAIWLVHLTKNAIFTLFSGGMIPFALLPWGIGDYLRYLPFGSLAGAALSVFTGLEPPSDIIPVQLLWNVILWPFAIWFLKKSMERMVSFGG